MRARLILLGAILIGQSSLAQWVLQTGGAEETLSDVVMLDSSTAIVVGGDGSVLKTTNAGETWVHKEPIIDAFTSWNCVSFCDSFHGIVAGRFLAMTTTNGGEEWTFNVVPAKGYLISVAYFSPGLIYAGDDSGWVHCSLDSGKTWTSKKISAGPIRSLFRTRGEVIIGVSTYALTPYSLCAQIVYPSSPWIETILPNFLGLGSEAFSGEYCSGEGTGFIVGVHGDLRAAPTVIRRKMSDTAWFSAMTGIVGDGTLLDVSAPSPNVIYVCGSQGMIFKSMNGGDAWSVPVVPTTQTLNALYFSDEKRGFAVGNSGTILHTENGGGVPVNVGKEPAASPKGFRLEQNFPNPFNSETVISYKLEVESFVTIALYDMLGREVATLINQQQTVNTNQVRWDASRFPAGVYIYRLTAGSYSDTKKLSLIK